MYVCMYMYLHALGSTAIGGERSNVDGLFCDWERRDRLETGERCNHASLSKAGPAGGNGGRRGDH